MDARRCRWGGRRGSSPPRRRRRGSPAAMRVVVGRDHDAADAGLDRPPPDMDDHRRAVDVGERLAGQPGRGHAGRDEDDGVPVIGMGVAGSAGGPAVRRVAKGLNERRLYGLPRDCGKACSFAADGSRRHDDSGCREARGREATMDSSNSTRSPAPCSAPALGVMALGIVAEIDLRAAARPEKPGFVIAVAETGGRSRGTDAGRRPAVSRSRTGCRPPMPTAGEAVGQEVPRLPHLRQGRAGQGRPEPLRRRRRAGRRTWRASTIRTAMLDEKARRA